MKIVNRKTAVPVLPFRSFLFLPHNSSENRWIPEKGFHSSRIFRGAKSVLWEVMKISNRKTSSMNQESGLKHVTLSKIKMNQQNSLRRDNPPAAVAPHYARHLYFFCLEFYVATHRFLEHYRRWSCTGPPVIGKYLKTDKYIY
ncbi:uncharacterized protein LOC134226749 [Armigeres subalbatus]|uniref:uncharacterized protein LOC134226749 n=1 Tax=Armigeres subalbatus TaxID=124917 RepID=UPI002ED0CEBE